MATYFETRSNSKKRSAGFCQVKNKILLSESCGRLEQPGTGGGGYSTHCQLFHGKSRRPLEESAVHLQMQCTGTLPYPTHAAVTFTFTLSLHRGCLWYTTNDYEISLLHFSLFSTALWDLANSRPVHSLILSSHLFFCLPCLLPPFTVPCKMVLARPDERGTCAYQFSLRLLTMVRSSCGPIARKILAQAFSLETWTLYETGSFLR